MGSFTLIGGGIVIGLAFMTSASGCVKFCVAIITIRGMSFLATRITQTMNKDAADIINFTGWSLAGVPVIGLLKLSTNSITILSESFGRIKESIIGIGVYLERFADVVDKVSFWN